MEPLLNRFPYIKEIFSVTTKKKKLIGKNGGVLAPSELFEHLLIKNHQQVPFVFGDNIDGYYEGYTHSFTLNKYHHKCGWILGGFASFIDKQINDKTRDISANIYPYGVTHYYDTDSCNPCNDTLMIFSGTTSQQRCVALVVESEQAAILSISPQLNISLTGSVANVFDNGVVYQVSKEQHRKGMPAFVALCADKSFICEEVAATFEYPELNQIALFNGQCIAPMLSSHSLETSMTVYITFADTEAEAIIMANAQLAQDGVTQHKQTVYDNLTQTYLWTSDLEYNRALMWTKAAGRVFVSTEYSNCIWAGLPWFKDCWGRDTFIALSGISLVNGFMDEAKKIIDCFAQWQVKDPDDRHYGRIPNRVSAFDQMIYNTTDGTPWMIRAMWDYLRYSGDIDYAKVIYPVVQTYIAGVEKHYLDDYGLMIHRDPDTWMDAKLAGVLPWSSRGDRANDIQALWYTSLQVAVKLAVLNGDSESKQHYQYLADTVKRHFLSLFLDASRSQLADCIKANNDRDMKVRPNQLMTLTVPYSNDFIDFKIGAAILSNTVSELLFPWGITSLSQYDPQFHPYHDNQNNYHKDAAYHNGTIWGWNAGFTITALTLYSYTDFAYSLTKNLTEQILYKGHRGTMSENVDAFLDKNSNITLSGTYAQAWSVSEFTRNGFQDYLGYQPDLIEGVITLSPSLPSAWDKVYARLEIGEGNCLVIGFTRGQTGEQCYEISLQHHVDLCIKLKLIAADKSKHLAVLTAKNKTMEIIFDPYTLNLSCNGVEIEMLEVQQSYQSEIGELVFAQPDLNITSQALQTTNWLQRQIEKYELVNVD